MKALIVCASRYGSTEEIGKWIAERLGYDGISADVVRTPGSGSVADFDLVVMGSGIYSHGVLPELKEFVEANRGELQGKPVALFGVAMKKETVLHKGKPYGGVHYLHPLAEMLDGSVLHAGMLLGEMVPQKLTDSEREGLMRFYRQVEMDEAEIKRRMSPRTLMSKSECWEFAEAVLRKLSRREAPHGNG
ncbi:MAG: flavodoxin domain-containing protein [Alphaproteobacteria bacterium]|uniref:Flavodoxin domain-containing protein n=1 Tax=Candidatus Nitrobium versatile TaxID=2884831 RepID=A0A953M2M9_9BACT|nr:flavodoxin domain-containing protein [Candidatus Nitrobium versatile]